MTRRPLQALLLPASAAGRITAALAAALDGTGPAVLPLDPGLPPARVAALLAAFRPALLETPDGLERLHVPPSPGAAGHGDVGSVPEDTAVVAATSGSTGEPKGVRLGAAAMLASARASLDRIGAVPGDRWLCPVPTSHIAGVGVLVRSLVAGSDPVVTGRLGPDERDLAQYGCTRVSLVPTQLRRLLAAGADVGVFDTILLGGAAAPGGLLARARAAGARVVTTYGMSETCGGCVYDGVPLDGVEVATAQDGRISIRGPVLFSGYHGPAASTSSSTGDHRTGGGSTGGGSTGGGSTGGGSVLDGGWLVTSDLGTVDGTGRLTVLGRADEMINTGGEKVAPAAVVAALEDCPGVREAAVFGEPDDEWGERVTAVIVPTDPSAPPTLAALRAHIRQYLPPYGSPRALVITPALPLLPNGKVDPAQLRGLTM